MSERKTALRPFIRRWYTRGELEDLWDFCQHDFERFLDLLYWLEDLPK